ncbi:MAG: MFS transporter [Ktedonobacterales bacterium]
MSQVMKPPCDEAIVLTAPPTRYPRSITLQAKQWALVATILGSSMAFIDSTVVNVALPVLQVQLRASAADAQWVIESYALFLSALILVGGSLGDRYGRKRIFALGIVLFTLASIACGFAPTITWLIAARAVQGIGGALLTPGSLAILSAAYPPEERGRAIGLWSGFTALTSALGPVIGGVLVQYASWRAIFFLNVPLAAVVLAIVFWRVQESREAQHTGPLDWQGASLATLGLGGIVFGLIQSSLIGLGAPLVIISIVIGVAALVAFMVLEERSPAPMLPLRLFRSSTFSGANLLTFLLYGALGVVTYLVPFNLIRAQGYSPTAAGAAFLPFALLMFALSHWSGGLVSRYGARLPLVVGPLITAAGLALFALLPGGSYWLSVFPAVLLMGLGMVITAPPLTTAVMNAAGTDNAGAASGVNNAVARTASLVAIAALSLVLLAVFNASLDAAIAPLHLDAATHALLDAQRSRLAGAQVPSTAHGALYTALAHAITSAFVTGFQVVMWLCAALAVVSSIAAAVLVEGKPASPSRRAQEE